MHEALALIALMPLVAACGAKEASTGSDRAPTDARSSRIRISLSGPEGFQGDGGMNYEQNLGELAITSNSLDIPGGEMRQRFIGRTIYMGMVLGGKLRWLKEPADEPNASELFTPGPGGPKPNEVLSVLRKASSEVETVGNEEIRGVATRHYRAHIDEKKLGKGAQDLPDDAVVNAWIDSEGLARRLSLPESRYEPSTIVMDLFDYGVPVKLEVPPAADVYKDEEFWKLVKKECDARPREKRRGDLFCSAFGFAGSDVQTMPRRVTDKK